MPSPSFSPVAYHIAAISSSSSPWPRTTTATSVAPTTGQLFFSSCRSNRPKTSMQLSPANPFSNCTSSCQSLPPSATFLPTTIIGHTCQLRLPATVVAPAPVVGHSSSSLYPIVVQSLPVGHPTLPSSTSARRPYRLCSAATQPLLVAAQPRPTLPRCYYFPIARLKAATNRSTRCHHRSCSSLAAPVILDPTNVHSSKRIAVTATTHRALPLLPHPSQPAFITLHSWPFSPAAVRDKGRRWGKPHRTFLLVLPRPPFLFCARCIFSSLVSGGDGRGFFIWRHNLLDGVAREPVIASSAGAPEGTGSALHERPLGSLRLWGFRVSPFRKGFPESSSQWRVPVVEGRMFLRLSFCVSDLEAIVSSPGDGYGSWVFLFRFALDCDRLKVLLEGPWSIFGGRNFAFDSMETTLTPILEEWVQLPTLRFEYNWEHETIFRIASLIDRPLKIDDCSMTFERWRYVRVCVEIDFFSQPSKQGVWIGKHEERIFQVLSDEKLPSVCFRCGCVGHRNCECPKKNPVMEPSKETLRVVTTAPWARCLR
ncbi:hypothetical protein B296_00037914 [Ensete ventricosum]|uniref:CCHC-type domain-containing protein n=1 Tax=Ensete ventricosum TaxID=4639 RepID=A0A426XEP1_ENSVE|nr:hypothetical protein B296_00037914 [Ensete ventricosum]